MNLINNNCDTNTTDEARRQLMNELRAEIQQSTPAIRNLKQRRRTAQRVGEWYEEHTLIRLRRDARARFLSIGLLRGRSWASVENNHPNGDEKFSDYLQDFWRRIGLDESLQVSLGKTS
jgi:hypothetical protein